MTTVDHSIVKESRQREFGDDAIRTENIDLFRKEALASLRGSLGNPFSQNNVSNWILVSLLFLILVSAAIFLFSATYTKHETVVGQLLPIEGSFKISSQISGTVKELFIKEGDFVSEGQVLANISTNQFLTSGRQLEESLNVVQQLQIQAQEQQADAKLAENSQQISELDEKKRGIANELVKLTELYKILERRHQLQTETYAANRDLAQKGMISALALRKEEDQVLLIEQQLEENQKLTIEQQNQSDQILPEIKRLRAEQSLARSESVAAKNALIEKDLNTKSHLSVKIVAPASGFVTALKIYRGSSVATDENLAVIVPANSGTIRSKLEAELWAPSKAIGFVKPGQTVRVMYDAFPYQTFGANSGTVLEISGSPTPPKDVLISNDGKEPLFRIRVSIERPSMSAYGKDWSLTPGMKLSADLILDRQSLFDILLEPLRATARRV